MLFPTREDWIWGRLKPETGRTGSREAVVEADQYLLHLRLTPLRFQRVFIYDLI